MLADLTMVKSGLCDRLKLLTFYIAVSRIKKDNVLKIKDQKTLEGPFLFNEICEIKDFEILPWPENSTEKNIAIDYGFEPDIKPSLSFVKRNKPKDLDIDDQALLEIWIDSYKKIVPKKYIGDKIDSLGINRDCLGLHIRMTDKVVSSITQAPTPRTMTLGQVKKINKIIEKEITKALEADDCRDVFLASDDGKWKEKWKDFLQKKGCRVISHEAKFEKNSFRQTSGEDFAIDLFALARCRKIIGTINSGVPISATYINGKSKYLFAFDRLVLSKKINHIHWQINRYYKDPYGLFHRIYIKHLIKYRLIKFTVRSVKRLLK